MNDEDRILEDIKEILKELEYLKGLYHKAAVDGRSRTCFSCVYRTEPFYISAVRDANSRNLEEIITDIPEISRQISDYLNSNSPEEKEKLRFYDDKLLPLYKLYRLETVLEEIQHEKVWLNSVGFLVIQQTEAFVSIDVNSGKFTGKKKMQETYRKINLEAAKEIARQLRLRNLSGIILIDFINMELPSYLEQVNSKDIGQDLICCECGTESICINEDILPIGTCLNCGYLNEVRECDRCHSWFDFEEEGIVTEDRALCQKCIEKLEDE